MKNVMMGKIMVDKASLSLVGNLKEIDIKALAIS
jgi:hypothetical protein